MRTSHKNEAEWPLNLVLDLTEHASGYPLDPTNLPDDFNASLEYVLHERAKNHARNVDILRAYYQNKISYGDIAHAYGLTRERIRQIVLKEHRALLHPGTRKFLVHGVSELLKQGKNSADETPKDNKPLYLMSVSDLNLSTRAFNVLRRAGCERVVDILGMSYDDLIRVRCSGPKTCAEIIACLENEGFDCSNLKPKED